jgi:hypothetical protein
MSATLLSGLVSFIATAVPSAGNAYPHEVPQGVSGWAYSVIDESQEIGHSGGQNFFRTRIQADLQYSETASASAYKATQTVADAMRAALDGYSGAMGSATVQFCKTEITDDWSPTSENPSVRFDIVIHYKI